MENKIPTALELLQKEVAKNENGDYIKPKPNITNAMIEFAKLHVQAALESALEDAPYGSSTDTVSYKDMKDAILNAYSLDNIK